MIFAGALTVLAGVFWVAVIRSVRRRTALAEKFLGQTFAIAIALALLAAWRWDAVLF